MHRTRMALVGQGRGESRASAVPRSPWACVLLLSVTAPTESCFLTLPVMYGVQMGSWLLSSARPLNGPGGPSETTRSWRAGRARVTPLLDHGPADPEATSTGQVRVWSWHYACPIAQSEALD